MKDFDAETIEHVAPVGSRVTFNFEGEDVTGVIKNYNYGMSGIPTTFVIREEPYIHFNIAYLLRFMKSCDHEPPQELY